MLPKALIAAHTFEEDVKALDTLRGQLDEVSTKLEELAEENGGEDGLFAQLDDLKKATVSARIKAIKKDPAAKEELAALKEYMSLLDAESNYKRQLSRLRQTWTPNWRKNTLS